MKVEDAKEKTLNFSTKIDTHKIQRKCVFFCSFDDEGTKTFENPVTWLAKREQQKASWKKVVSHRKRFAIDGSALDFVVTSFYLSTLTLVSISNILGR